ncbi:MAG: hypothetical protein M3R17_01035 [Bacteroidota bacterium]|nr:hypothetical protein [Bacteroidota bacterium]
MNFNKPGRGQISLIISSMMLVVYLSLAYLFLFTDFVIDKVPRPNRIYVGIVFIVWGAFRAITSWFRYKRMNQEDEEL